MIEARRLGLRTAITIVHAFPTSGPDHFEDVQAFGALFGQTIEKGRLARLTTVDGIAVWIGWADGVSSAR